MKIITLTTDFGLKDYSVGAVKGALYTQCSNCTVVDISHLVSPFDIFQTAYILKNAYAHFPKGSIHIIGVDTESTPERKHLIMYLNDHYFIGTDNGIFHLLAEDNPIEIYEVAPFSTSSLFPTLAIFPNIAKKICDNVPLDQIGNKIFHLTQASHFKPEISSDNSFIHGTIIYIDHYGNAVSNISRSLFEDIKQDRNFEIIFNMYSFKKIYNNYSEIINFNTPINLRNPDGKRLLLFNELNYLQCCVYKSDKRSVGGASSLLGINYLDRVSIHFYK